jgi:hypothetical protein
MINLLIIHIINNHQNLLASIDDEYTEILYEMFIQFYLKPWDHFCL